MFVTCSEVTSVLCVFVSRLAPKQIEFTEQKQELSKRTANTGRRTLSHSISQSSTDSYGSGTETCKHATHTHALKPDHMSFFFFFT